MDIEPIFYEGERVYYYELNCRVYARIYKNNTDIKLCNWLIVPESGEKRDQTCLLLDEGSVYKA